VTLTTRGPQIVQDEFGVPLSEDTWEVALLTFEHEDDRHPVLHTLSYENENAARDTAAMLCMGEALVNKELAIRITGGTSQILQYLGLYHRHVARVKEVDPTPTALDVKRIGAFLAALNTAAREANEDDASSDR
jgi:hypothetical protein